ncbi:FecR domain-containing protein [Polyangium mundeleinium]|uniref:FecR domain-containing protein n=1 Tax=Polyangium mundeleinium TaxID=2995306 RepID=A0ABT5F2L4_9BACT|nr:FecR domain-containing protein [Polyangium mundeleinium]MDC0748341.1 FecR domain-containing protein [Polyangium mundeleinium]
MTRRVVPPLRPQDLRDHADPARIERVWERLEHDLPGRREPERSRMTGTLIAVAAAAVAAFCAGLYVGTGTSREGGPTEVRAISAENNASPSVLAAGTRQASYPLPGGGTLTLSPGATVEVERGEGEAVTLRLLRGEASVDTAGAPKAAEIALVAEGAALFARAGSVVFVRRNEADIDVRVASGSARVSWPAGSRELSGGDGLEAVPMIALAEAPHDDPTNPDPRPRRAIAPMPRDMSSRTLALPLRPETPAVAIAAPDWRAKYNAGELAQALELLRQQPGGIEGAIASSRSAAELVVIGDIARAKGGDPSAALLALTRVVEGFPNDPYAEIAAFTLGGMYEKMGQADQAQKYFERARSLKGVLAEDALCKQIRAEHRAGRKDEAARMGTEYSNKYPDGRCKEDVERILSGEEPTQEEPQASPDAGAGDASAP